MLSAATPCSRDWDAVVVGGGIAGLTAAWECVQHGLRPILVEARGYTGGLVAAAPIGGVRMDLGAEGFVMRGEAVTSMVDALGLDVVGPSGGGARLFLPPLAEASEPERASTPHAKPALASTCASLGSEDARGHRPVLSPRAEGDAPQAARGEGMVTLPEATTHGWELHRFVRDSFLGIPAHPLAEDAVRVLGTAGAARAAHDAEIPGEVGTRPQDPADLASFVRARMGEAVLDRLVRPIVAGIHTSDPADLAADTVAPGLRAATARLGSLQAAVAELLEARRARKRAGSAADVTTPGGLVVFTDALRAAIEDAGGQVLTRTGARSLCRLSPLMADGEAHLSGGVPLPAGPAREGREEGADGPNPPQYTWALTITPTQPGATPSAEPVPAGEEQVLLTDRLILACSAGAAKRLLASAGLPAEVEVPMGSPIARAMLVLRAPGLDPQPSDPESGHPASPAQPTTEASTRDQASNGVGNDPLAGPVGSGLLVAPPPYPPDSPCPVEAKALSHLNVKWPWIGRELEALHGEHVHALRLSYGRPGEPSPQPSLARVLADASALTGVELREEDVIAFKVIHWDGTLPPVTPEFRARTREIVAAANAWGLALTGAWVAGTGIASVVAHAREQAARVCTAAGQIPGLAAHASAEAPHAAPAEAAPPTHARQDQVRAWAKEASASGMTGPSGHGPEGEKQA